MSSFLSKLKPEQKINVGVSVSTTAGLEMIVVDPTLKKVTKYAQRPIAYNTSNREIEDYSEFKILLTELFNELKINPAEANVVLNLPSVYFSHMMLPTTLDDESINTALTAEAEKEYLFKKNVPVISWQEVKSNNTAESRYILFSAIQEGVVDVITQIFTDIGATLVAIENTYSSLLKTLEFTGLTKDFAKTPGSWNILLVSQNSFSVFSLMDYNILEYYEDPLPIKAFNGDEAYVAITQAASPVLEKFPSDKLIIISESGDISAEILAIQLKQPGEVTFLECNQYANLPVMEVDFSVLPSYVKNITPEAIGAAIYRVSDFSLKMNFMKKTEVKDDTLVEVFGFSLTKEQLYIYTAIIGVIIVAIGYFCSMVVGLYTSGLDRQRDVQTNEEQTLKVEYENLQKESNKIDIYSIVKQIDKSMVEKILYYNAIGADIPVKVWITSFYADSRGAYGIEGQTTSVDDVYLFYRNIKSQVPQSDMILSKLGVDDKDGLIDIDVAPNANYSFALSNSKYSPEKAGAAKDANNSGSNTEVPALPNELPN